MKILKFTCQHRHDFKATIKCEYCGHTQELAHGYDDDHYHNNVMPTITCESCGCDRSGRIPESNPDGAKHVSQLKACPFCGNEADTNDDGNNTFYLSCMGYDCETQGPVRQTMEEAITAWNCRA